MRKSTVAATGLGVTAAAVSGSMASTRWREDWYSTLRKPSFLPPSWAFPVAWTSIYTDIAVSSATAIDSLRESGRDAEARHYVAALGLNLSLNAAWSWLFFRFHKLGPSAIGAGLLAASSVDLARRTAQANPRAGLAISAYPLWCGFATALSTQVWRLNRR